MVSLLVSGLRGKLGPCLALVVVLGAIIFVARADAPPPTPAAAAASGPTCFGAASRDPQHACRNPRLRLAVKPTPATAVHTRNAPCRIATPLQAVPVVCTFAVTRARARGATVALLGDSHASHWRAAVDYAIRSRGRPGVSLTRASCPYSEMQRVLPEPARSRCTRWVQAIPRWFRLHPEINTVLVSGLASAKYVVPKGTSMFEARVRAYTRAWRRLPASVQHIVVIRDTPKGNKGTRGCIEHAVAQHRRPGVACALPRNGFLPRDPAVTAARRMHSPRVAVVDLSAFMCSDLRCSPVVGGALVRKDTHHLTASFARTLGPYLERRMTQVMPAWASTATKPRPVPVLLYHRIERAPAGVKSPALYVGAKTLRRQLRALADDGYRAVTLAQVWRHWRMGAALPSKPVVLSFDDGYATQFTAALPALKAVGFRGVLYLQTGRLGVPGGLTEGQVHALAAAGWEIGAHTATHPDLTKVGDEQLQEEVAGSRTVIRDTFGVPAAFFAYPFGHFDARVAAAVKAAGFLGATTTQRGLATAKDDPYALHRIIVTGKQGPITLLRNLREAGAG